MPSIFVKCPNLGNDADNPCEYEHELECDTDPGDSNYGADADGNRGIYVGPSLLPPGIPVSCPQCHLQYDEEQQKELGEEIDRLVRDWEPPDYEPDYD